MFCRANQKQVSQLFHGMGELDGEHEIKLKSNVQPFAITTPRHIPLPLKSKVRLPFGLTSAPERFQKRILTELEDLEGMICIMDDIPVHGRTPEEYDEQLDAVLKRQGKNHPDKCEFSNIN